MQLKTSALAGAVLALSLWGCGGSDPPPPEIATPRALSRMEQLGKDLFFDLQLSEPRGQSCASCHDAKTGFAGNFASPIGVPLAADGATLGLRNTPTAAYGGFTPPFTIEEREGEVVARGGQFLDGRAAGLEEQAVVPFFAGGEMNLATPAVLAARIAARPYAAAMRAEFGATILDEPEAAVRAVGRAIAAFERTAELAPFSSRLDRWLERGEPLAPREAEGLRLFVDPAKGNCASCHAFDPESRARGDRLFTDFTYRALGAPRNAAIPANADPAFYDLGLCGPRRERVADDRLCGAFKVPTLRNVARKDAFMHNGVFRKLRDAVAFHASRDAQPGRWYVSGTRLDDLPPVYRANVAALRIQLDDAEVDAITAFLGTLDD